MSLTKKRRARRLKRQVESRQREIDRLRKAAIQQAPAVVRWIEQRMGWRAPPKKSKDPFGGAFFEIDHHRSC